MFGDNTMSDEDSKAREEHEGCKAPKPDTGKTSTLKGEASAVKLVSRHRQEDALVFFSIFIKKH